jgi:hypothetical protein
MKTEAWPRPWPGPGPGPHTPRGGCFPAMARERGPRSKAPPGPNRRAVSFGPMGETAPSAQVVSARIPCVARSALRSLRPSKSQPGQPSFDALGGRRGQRPGSALFEPEPRAPVRRHARPPFPRCVRDPRHLTRALTDDETKIMAKYVKSKGVLGWSTAFDVEIVPFGLALRAELQGMGVDLARVEVSGSDVKTGALVIRFPWRHPTEDEETTREVVYWRGDITTPWTYEELLDAHDASIDVYRHSAAMDIPAMDYPRGEKSFLNFHRAARSRPAVGNLGFRHRGRGRVGATISAITPVNSPCPGRGWSPARSSNPSSPPRSVKPGPRGWPTALIKTFAPCRWERHRPGGKKRRFPGVPRPSPFCVRRFVRAVEIPGAGGYAAYVLFAVLVAPVVEEYVFRHLVFGGALEAVVRAVAGEICPVCVKPLSRWGFF